MKNKMLMIFRPFIWVVMVNSLIAILISARYFSYMPELPNDLLGITFLISSAISQMTLLSLLLGLSMLPLAFIAKKYYAIAVSLVAATGLLLLITDTFVFAQYRFHINAVVLELVMSGQVVDFSIMNQLSVVAAFILLLAIEYLLILQLISRNFFKEKPIIKKFASVFFLTLLVSNVVHIWGAANVYRPITMVKRYLPVFYPATANSLMAKYGWIDIEAISAEKERKINIKGDLKYPLAPLEVKQPDNLYDIVFIVIDSWRFDTFNAMNTPNIWKYSEKGRVFENHYATGNATRTGIFGLFYGIPGTYWHSFLANQQSPVLTQRLQSLDYQLGIFAAASLEKPEFSQTVFRDVKNLRMGSEGDSPSARDENLTQDWLTWYSQRDLRKPTFSFLFYDAPHGYDFPPGYPEIYSPMAKSVDYLALNNDRDPTLLFNRYKNSVHYVDSLVSDVFSMVEQSSNFDNTVFVITGDHGQEMNDNKLNFWGHNSNFTDAQVKVPFIMIAPESKTNNSSTNMTSHQDVAPTILKNYLGVTSELSDYSLGIDLLDSNKDRKWIFSSNYSGYAIIDEKSILEVDEFGQYQLLDKSNRSNSSLKINYSYLQEALEDMKRFSN